jgi:phage shock protein PspC (stress-responsive transcriptional regulator)
VADRLYRSPTDRVIAGVAGGLATWLNLDPSLVRVAWVLLAFLSGGIFVLVYIVMMIVVPLPPPGWVPGPRIPGAQPWASAGQGWAPGGPGATAGGPSAEAGAAGSTAPGSVPGWNAGQPVAWGPGSGPAPGQPWTPPRVDTGGAGIVFGAILVLLGAWFLADRYIDIDWDLVWPIVVIGLGLAMIAWALMRHRPPR